MFDYINGICTYKTSGAKGNFATIETGGVGYCFEIMNRDYEKLQISDDKIKIYSVLIHREDKMSLCGFLTREDRDVFNILTSVSGVGAKMAIALLDSFEVADMAGFVLNEDYKELTKAKGVGPKLAQKIILELKDKFTSYKELSLSAPNMNTFVQNSQNLQDARMVLLSLGYNNEETDAAMKNALSKLNDNAAAEEILKESLKLLSVN